MTNPEHLDAARMELDRAAAIASEAEVRADLADRPGLAYAAVDHEQEVFLVSHEGRVLGKLRHPAAAGALAGWFACPDHGPEVGPFHTARHAAVALLRNTGALPDLRG